MSDYKKLYRSRDKKICGVCGGIAEYFEFDPVILRLIWIALSFFSCSVAAIAYFICALVIPMQPLVSEPQQPKQPQPEEPKAEEPKTETQEQ